MGIGSAGMFGGALGGLGNQTTNTPSNATQSQSSGQQSYYYQPIQYGLVGPSQAQNLWYTSAYQVITRFYCGFTIQKVANGFTTSYQGQTYVFNDVIQMTNFIALKLREESKK